MRGAVIVDAVRAPSGRRKGTLKGVHPVDLSASVLTALAGRSQLDPELIADENCWIGWPRFLPDPCQLGPL